MTLHGQLPLGHGCPGCPLPRRSFLHPAYLCSFTRCSARPSSIRQEHSMLTITSNAPGQPSQRQHAGRQQGAHGPKGSLAVSGAYLPAVHTVLAPEGRAPSHSQLEEAVLAAQVAQTAHGQVRLHPRTVGVCGGGGTAPTGNCILMILGEMC